jgi:hypothetical protein
MTQGQGFFLYTYRKSLGNKHQGTLDEREVEAVLNRALQLIKFDMDVSQILVEDLDGFCVFHWNEDEGCVYPEELREKPEFGPRNLLSSL